MYPPEHPDIVDEPLIPFVRPLGNLLIAAAQAEAAVLELLTELKGGDEKAAAAELKADRDLKTLKKQVRDVDLDSSSIDDVFEALEVYDHARHERHRLIHGEWFIGIDDEYRVVIGIRGIPHKPPAEVVWREPEIQEIWDLAREFKACRLVFSSVAQYLHRRRVPEVM